MIDEAVKINEHSTSNNYGLIFSREPKKKKKKTENLTIEMRGFFFQCISKLAETTGHALSRKKSIPEWERLSFSTKKETGFALTKKLYEKKIFIEICKWANDENTWEKFEVLKLTTSRKLWKPPQKIGKNTSTPPTSLISPYLWINSF